MSTPKKENTNVEEVQAALQALIAQGKKEGMIRLSDLNARRAPRVELGRAAQAKTAIRAHQVIFSIIANFCPKVNCMFSRILGKTVREGENN